MKHDTAPLQTEDWNGADEREVQPMAAQVGPCDRCEATDREVLPWHGTERLCGKCFDAISDEKVADAQRRELEQLDVSQLLDDVAAYIRRYVAMSAAQGATLALWVLHTHALEAVRVTPYIWVTSPEAGSGKTLLLEVLETVVPRPWLTGRTTAAVLPRKVDKEQPTLLLDESDADSAATRSTPRRSEGFSIPGTSGQVVPRCASVRARASAMPTSPLLLQSNRRLGKAADTVRDRAIRIRLDKLAPDEKVEEFDEEIAERVALYLRGRLEDIGVDSSPASQGQATECESGFSPRMKEIVRPLLAVADLAGGEWTQRALRALCEITGADAGEDKSAGVELLSDVRDAFESLGVDRISTKDLREHLIDMEERPWCEWTARGHHYPAEARQAAQALRHHRPEHRAGARQDPQGIPPRAVRGRLEMPSPAGTAVLSATPPQWLYQARFGTFPSATRGGCGGYETPENPHEQGNVALWRIENPPSGSGSLTRKPITTLAACPPRSRRRSHHRRHRVRGASRCGRDAARARLQRRGRGMSSYPRPQASWTGSWSSCAGGQEVPPRDCATDVRSCATCPAARLSDAVMRECSGATTCITLPAGGGAMKPSRLPRPRVAVTARSGCELGVSLPIPASRPAPRQGDPLGLCRLFLVSELDAGRRENATLAGGE